MLDQSTLNNATDRLRGHDKIERVKQIEALFVAGQSRRARQLSTFSKREMQAALRVIWNTTKIAKTHHKNTTQFVSEQPKTTRLLRSQSLLLHVSSERHQRCRSQTVDTTTAAAGKQASASGGGTSSDSSSSAVTRLGSLHSSHVTPLSLPLGPQ